jgi:hypothetical protein
MCQKVKLDQIEIVKKNVTANFWEGNYKAENYMVAELVQSYKNMGRNVGCIIRLFPENLGAVSEKYGQ